MGLCGEEIQKTSVRESTASPSASGSTRKRLAAVSGTFTGSSPAKRAPTS